MNVIGMNKRRELVNICDNKNNRNIIVTGKPGVGKSTLVLVQLLQSAEAGETIITFNWHNCLEHDLMLPEHKEKYEKHVKVINVAKEGIKLPLFDPMPISDGSLESESSVIQRVTTMLSIATDLTASQEQQVFTCIKDVYQKDLYFEQGIKAIDDWLNDQEKTIAKAAAAKVRSLTVENLFRHGDFFDDETKIYEFDLNGLEYDSQLKVLKFMLEYLLRMANRRLFNEREITVFVDEAAYLDYSKNSTMFNILGETRKMGLNMILAFPSLFSGIKKGKEMDIVTGAATCVYFEPLDKDRRKIAELIDPKEYESWVSTLSHLTRGEFVIKSRLECNGRIIENPMTLKTVL